MTDDVLRREKGSKVDIYEYCAVNGGTPDFKYRRMPRHKVFEITASFPQQNIKVIVRHRDPVIGETITALLFKKQAEKWHTQNAEASVQVKNLLTLNASNARQFFDLCKQGKVISSYDCVLPEKGAQFVKGLHSMQIKVNDEPFDEPIFAGTKKAAENLAYLVAGQKLREKNPETFSKFLEALKIGKGEILKPIPPLYFRTRWEYLQPMVDTVNMARRIGIPKEYSSTNTEKGYSNTEMRRFTSSGPSPEALSTRSLKLFESLKKYDGDESIKLLREKRAGLPMNQYAPKVLELVKNNTVSIIVGATGSGKTSM
jgi:ATP-dependent RNA helicase DHX36